MLSGKRMPSGHYLSDSPGYLEFNALDRKKYIDNSLLQPADMAWSIDEFMKRMDELETGVREKMDVRVAELKAEMDAEMAKMFPEGMDQEDVMDRWVSIHEEAEKLGGGYSKAKVRKGLAML